MPSSSSLKMNWKTFLSNRKKSTEFFLTITILAVVLILFSQFLLFIEERTGVTLSDPILNLFSPIDLTWLTFVLIYLSLITALVELIKIPERLLLALQCYGLMVIFRSIAMYLSPFEAPLTLLPLNDPFVQLFGEGNILEKDLFFSGHTSYSFYSATFISKVFSDMNPDSNFRYAVFGLTHAVAAFVGYMRYEAGKHFPTDVIAGAAVGSLIGYLVPELHANASERIGLNPVIMNEYKGIAIAFSF